jgi:ubiquitin-conjugating enzyme E2 J1
VSIAPNSLSPLQLLTSSVKYLRSREWVCSRCNRSNLQCLPDPPESSDPSTSRPLAKSKPSPEAEVVPDAAETIPPQIAESNASASVREATPDDVDSAPRSESVDATLVMTSPPATAPTPSQNFSGVRGAHQAASPTPPFRPSQTHTTVRPPMLLDTAICVLLVLVFALLLRRIF